MGGKDGGRIVSADENKALVRRAFEEGWNAGNLDVFDEVEDPERRGQL